MTNTINKETEEMACWIVRTIEANSPETAAIIIMEQYASQQKPVSEPVGAEGKSVGHIPLAGIEESLREFYTTNKENKGSGYGRRLLIQIINDVADAHREIYTIKK